MNYMPIVKLDAAGKVRELFAGSQSSQLCRERANRVPLANRGSYRETVFANLVRERASGPCVQPRARPSWVTTRRSGWSRLSRQCCSGAASEPLRRLERYRSHRPV